MRDSLRMLTEVRKIRNQAQKRTYERVVHVSPASIRGESTDEPPLVEM